MRCIEINNALNNNILALKININMRCIEIAIAELQSPAVAGLTLT